MLKLLNTVRQYTGPSATEIPLTTVCQRVNGATQGTAQLSYSKYIYSTPWIVVLEPTFVVYDRTCTTLYKSRAQS